MVEVPPLSNGYQMFYLIVAMLVKLLQVDY